MVALSMFRQRGPSFADLMPYAALVEDGTLLLKDGSLLAGWYFFGPDTESATPLERNRISHEINAIISKLGSGWMLQVDSLRVPSVGYHERERSHFPDPVSRAIDEERRRHFKMKDRHFESRQTLVLTYKPTHRAGEGMSQFVFSTEISARTRPADRALAAFSNAIREIEQYLSATITLQRMRVHRVNEVLGLREARFDSLLQFVRFCISGENMPVRLPDVGMYLDCILTAQMEHGTTPKLDDRHIGVVAIDGFPSQSWPGILNALDQMPLSYRWSSRFIFLDAEDARRRLEQKRRRWQQKVRPFLDQLFQTDGRSLDQDAATMVAETEHAIGQANSGLVAFGYYTSVIVLFDDHSGRLLENAELVRRMIQAEGFGARIETLNATEAYLGSLPGNWYANVRDPLINTNNLADLLPLNSVWTGDSTAPCPFYPSNAPALIQVASGSTPFHFNLHHEDVGHTLIFGPTGSGKSTLLALIAAQFRRYENAQIFAFDKGMSLMPLTRAVGGDHHEIGAEADGRAVLSFCPLAELETDADRAFATEFVETLLVFQGVTVTPLHRNAIAHQIALMAASPGRSLSDFVSGVQSREIKEGLTHYTVNGPMGHLMDAEKDTLSFQSFQCIELEALMTMGERNLVPVLLHLFRRIEKRLTGAPSLIILDEAWLMLGHPVFREKIREWLKVLRKANCAVILATQSISDAERSGIVDVLVESCPTKICLANPAAETPSMASFYERLGFNHRQIEIIATARPKKDYYCATPKGRRLFEMALGPLTLAFTGVSDAEQIRTIKTLCQAHGPDWPRHWLSLKGETDALSLLDD
ncbi:VirB4 family type IV secretion/conjugal transfer ATPase (plasmid) [Rhizobium rosettiformans]|uniref:VirB4 family type IV secretion/conjugal transfer ATPase n=1 Tax=Rhizobium rosettiformans TaxID=1368430 RepID=A0ABX7F4H9_9HYPH|nr:VirB4 family type IV secretion/conjugal transfer ATPase [Rhizobium rosettiformans]QRF54291.1 VirB4 family type IV secretion/conjugal transfer ATPase [Rhizobium rosettiformans]